MSQGLGRLFRSCRSPVALLMTAGALIANAQNSVPDPGARIYSRLAMQVDTTVVPGTRDFLEPNVPNPFGTSSSTTQIAFTISQTSHVELRVYDFFYNEVVTLIDGERSAGRHVVRFDPPPTMPSGMYFYELKTGHFRELRRLVYIK